MGRKFINLVNQKFGRLTALYVSHSCKNKHMHWSCICECGTSIVVRGSCLTQGVTTSCGCYRTDINTKHGMRRTVEYSCWDNMKARCYNTKNTRYKDWGGRGIRVCDRWLESFAHFYEDMGDRPKGKSIDRIDNDGNYEPTNCKWSTPQEQALNKRRAV